MMLAFAVGKAAPPAALVMLDYNLGVFGTGDFAQTEPEEDAFPVFFILVEVAKVNISI